MRPRQLSMEGFGAFRERTTVDFDGLELFAIAGPTGAGKSTLLDAITFALYGRVPRVGVQVGELISLGLERAQVTLENLARVHPQLQQPGLILQTASMAWDNHPYSSGAFAWLSPGQQDTLYQHLISPEGRLFFAGEHASLTPTWQQGALESAQRVLKQLLPGWPPGL